jgi:hypothetical protein
LQVVAVIVPPPDVFVVVTPFAVPVIVTVTVTEQVEEPAQLLPATADRDAAEVTEKVLETVELGVPAAL